MSNHFAKLGKMASLTFPAVVLLSAYLISETNKGNFMPRYTKKPVTIEAFKLGKDPLPDWFVDKITSNDIITSFEKDGQPFETESPFQDASEYIVADIKTLEGTMRADNGDYIIQGIKGEIYPCKPDIFEASYDAVEPKSESEAVDEA